MKKTGHAARRATSSNARGATSTSSRSHASGDDGSVNPTVEVDDDDRAGAAPPNARRRRRTDSATARPRAERRLAVLQRRPAQRLAPAPAPAARSRPRSARAPPPPAARSRTPARRRAPPAGAPARPRWPPRPHDHAVRRQRLLDRHEPERDVALDRLDRPVEPVLPAAAARGAVDQHVARLDRHLVALGRQHLLGPVDAPQDLRRALARLARRARPTAASASGRRGSRRAPARGTRSASRRRCRRGGSPAPPESVTVV